MAPSLTGIATTGARTLRAFANRIPGAGEVVAQSLSGAVDGKITLITGASQGIGRATALEIGRAGGEVLLVARTKEKLDEVRVEVERAGGVAHVHSCNLTSTDDIDRMSGEVIEQHGHVDILINNAGKSIRRSVSR
ncbi:MAG: SDR family NAD(P)-dependent oxidoreductase, partial [Solirubrobacterales bacterium]|nr:SDR family NAD(P)-dependent oxidoreductase [Solirubrobacterales bacterium]